MKIRRIKIQKRRGISLDAFPLVKRAAFLELVIRCLCEKKNIDIEKFFKKLKEADVERIWNLNNDDIGLKELMNKEKKGRIQLCKEKIMKVLEDF